MNLQDSSKCKPKIYIPVVFANNRVNPTCKYAVDYADCNKFEDIIRQ